MTILEDSRQDDDHIPTKAVQPTYVELVKQKKGDNRANCSNVEYRNPGSG